jgi:hypothetical protein
VGLRSPTEPRLREYLELVSAVLLALATVGTAWSAYQARQWTGEQSQGYSHATAKRIAENRASAIANRQVQIDVATFIQWVDASKSGRPELADFYRRRFRPEFTAAFSTWLAQKPFTNAAAAKTPFDLPQYRLKATAAAEGLERRAAADSQRAKDANQHADDYMVAVVLFSSALFFAGISMKLQTSRARAATLGMGCLVFLGTAIFVATLPVP